MRRLLHDAVERVLHPRDRLLVEPVHLERPRHRQHHNAVQLLEGKMMRSLFGFHVDVRILILAFVFIRRSGNSPVINLLVLCIPSSISGDLLL